jgi:HK97 family phage major capsid protein
MSLTTSGNSTLTQDVVERVLILPLTQQSSYLSLGFPTFTSAGQPIKVPSLSTLGTPTYVAEGSAIPEVNATTSEISLLPSTVQSLKVITKMTREAVRQSVVNVESIFSTKLVSDVSRVLDSALWNGNGTNGAPTGMANFANVTVTGTAAGTLNADDLLEMQEDAMQAFVMPGNMTWAMSPANFTRVRKFTDNYGARVLQPSLAAGAPPTLLGSPYVVTTHIPDSTILLFDRSQVAVGMDDRASVTVLSELYAGTDEVGIKVTARYDTAALNPKAVVKLSGITA